MTFTLLINACIKAGDIEEAKQWYQKALREEVKPRVVTFTSIIDACLRHGRQH